MAAADAGATSIAAMLRVSANKTLSHLDLEYNAIADSGAFAARLAFLRQAHPT